MRPEKEIQNTLEEFVVGSVRAMSFFKVWNGEIIEKAEAERFLLSFDSLVKSFPALIAAGAARAEDEETRGILAVNLFQECGEGDLSKTHHAIYRKFLKTAGIDQSFEVENSFAAAWREDLAGYINQTQSVASALGALASGEFLAQPVLGRVYSRLKTLFPQADQEYFTKHLIQEGEHVQEMTKLIFARLKKGYNWDEVLIGFRYGLSVWETYFNHLGNFLIEKKTNRELAT